MIINKAISVYKLNFIKKFFFMNLRLNIQEYREKNYYTYKYRKQFIKNRVNAYVVEHQFLFFFL